MQSQFLCVNPGCHNYISVKALNHERNTCKVCRKKNGTLQWTCRFRYNDGRKCQESNHKYHFHCSDVKCNGAVFCGCCTQCPNCNPCH